MRSRRHYAILDEPPHMVDSDLGHQLTIITHAQCALSNMTENTLLKKRGLYRSKNHEIHPPLQGERPQGTRLAPYPCGDGLRAT